MWQPIRDLLNRDLHETSINDAVNKSNIYRENRGDRKSSQSFKTTESIGKTDEQTIIIIK